MPKTSAPASPTTSPAGAQAARPVDPSDRVRSCTSLEDETVVDRDLGGLDLAGKDFCRCRFVRVKLAETRWHGARLEDCVFEDCDLTRMQPGDAGLHDVRFLRCKLMGVSWERSSPGTVLAFADCDLRYASFVALALRRAPFLRCRAQEASFVDADLQHADFAGTDLTGASFQGADLRDADLSAATGAFVDPSKNRVRGLRVSLETAALLAASFGMRVAGQEPDEREE